MTRKSKARLLRDQTAKENRSLITQQKLTYNTTRVTQDNTLNITIPVTLPKPVLYVQIGPIEL